MQPAEPFQSDPERSSTTLSWQGRPFLELTRLAWPIAVATVSFSVMTLVDTLIVGRLGTAALAGVGLAGTAAFFLICFSIGLLQGAKVLVSQAVGAGRQDEVHRYVAVAVTTAVTLGLLTTAASELAAAAIAHLAATEAAGLAARTYLQIRALGAPLVLVYAALREVLQAQGHARAPMVATVLANVVNVGLALVFVFVLHLGVAGAAWAAVIAHGIEAGVLVGVQRSRGGFGLLPASWSWRGLWDRAFSPSHFPQLIRIGLPTGLQFMLEIGSFATLTLAVATFSEVDMAAHQIALQLIHFSFMPCVALGEAASVLVGQAVGANRDDLVPHVGRRAAGLAMAYAGLCSLAFLFAGGLIAARFTTDLMVVALAVQLLRLAGLFQVFDAINIVARCVLRGTGDVRYAAVVGVTVAWLCTPTLAWGLGHGLRLGALGGWLGIAIEVLLCSIILGLRVERRGWATAARRSRSVLQGDSLRAPTSAAFSLNPRTPDLEPQA